MSKKTYTEVDTYDPLNAVLDEDRIARAIWECLKQGDSKGVMEVIEIYCDALDTSLLLEQGNLPKTTFYHAKRNKNPTLKTLAKLVHSVA